MSSETTRATTPSEVRRMFLEERAVDLGVSAELLDRPGTTIAPHDDRAGSQRVACYQFGQHAVLACDPGVVDELTALEDPAASLQDEAFRTWAVDRGGEVIGDAVMRTQMAPLPSVPVPGQVHRFDWSRAADLKLMQSFVDESSADDLDEAEVEMDDLDDQAIALLADDGSIMAYASSRSFDEASVFGDIGVIVAAGARQGGWGRAVVATLVRDVLEPAGVLPLYRCSTENLGSYGLSSALGFESALSLTMAQLRPAVN